MQLVRHGDGARRARTVLGDDEIRLTTTRVVTLERIRTMKQHNHIRVLLDRSRFTQIRQLRLLVRALLGSTVQLAHRHHRHFQLLRQELDLPGEFGHFLLA